MDEDVMADALRDLLDAQGWCVGECMFNDFILTEGGKEYRVTVEAVDEEEVE